MAPQLLNMATRESLKFLLLMPNNHPPKAREAHIELCTGARQDQCLQEMIPCMVLMLHYLSKRLATCVDSTMSSECNSHIHLWVSFAAIT